MLSTLLRNLFAGLQVYFSPNLSRDAFHVTLPHMALLLIVGVAVLAIFDYTAMTHVIYQDTFGTALLIAYFGIGLLLAVVATHLERDYPALPRLLTVVLSALPWLFLLISVFPLDWAIAQQAKLVPWMLVLISLALIVRCLQIAFIRPRKRTFAVTLLGALLSINFGWQNAYFPSLFDQYNPAEFAEAAPLDVEHILFSQAALMSDKLSRVHAGDPAVSEYFFIGFGGSNQETVFDTETAFAEQLLDQRYDTRTRSVRLFNDAQALDKEPIANTYNLARAIDHVGRQMNATDDILFLLLSSHGGRNAELDVQLDSLPLRDLNVNDVRRYLDEAGVRWRVIVISACFSGSFIDTLADDQTLVITASNAEQPSFGCSSDRELTVFGDAYFKHALTPEVDFVQAFNQAATLVRTWEQERELPFSHPQISVGTEIAKKLKLSEPDATLTTPKAPAEALPE